MLGTYTLLIELDEDSEIQIGKLGEIEFRKGGYAYVGSGLNNLEKRIERHLREDKKLYWHIDYFLTEATVREVLYGKSDEKKECEIAENLAEELSFINGFGASDCGCNSHLFYSEDISKLKEKVKTSFRKAGLEIRIW